MSIKLAHAPSSATISGNTGATYIEDYVPSTANHDAAIEAAITAATTASPKRNVIAGARTYSIVNAHSFDQVGLIGQPGATKFQATNAAARVICGTDFGGAPRNAGHRLLYGGFEVDGGAVVDRPFVTNTVDCDYRDINVANAAANGKVFSILGQNNEYYGIGAGNVTGNDSGGICLDVGAGGNTIDGFHVAVVGGAHVDIRQSIASTGGYVGGPSDNVLRHGVWDQQNLAPMKACIRQRAGAWNVFVDSNLYGPNSDAIVKLEGNSGGFTGTGYVNGRLIFRGRTQMTAGAYAFWADFVSGGAAGAMAGDIAVMLGGVFEFGGQTSGVFKWGTTTAIISDFADITRYNTSASNPWWTADGTGALTGVTGPLIANGNIGFGEYPGAEKYQLSGVLQVTQSGAGIRGRSGASNQNAWLSSGRTAEEAQVGGIAGGVNNFFSGSAAGDRADRLTDTTKAGHIGVSDGTTAAEIRYARAKLGFYGTAPITQQTLAAAATDAATTQTLANSLRTALINLGLGV